MEFKATALLPPYHHSTAAQRLESDRMPRRFHFDRIENPIRVFPLATEVISYSATDVTLDVDKRCQPAIPRRSFHRRWHRRLH